jgi:hypothetical protein
MEEECLYDEAGAEPEAEEGPPSCETPSEKGFPAAEAESEEEWNARPLEIAYRSFQIGDGDLMRACDTLPGGKGREGENVILFVECQAYREALAWGFSELAAAEIAEEVGVRCIQAILGGWEVRDLQDPLPKIAKTPFLLPGEEVPARAKQFTAWIKRVARNLMIDRLRRKQPMMEPLEEDLFPEGGPSVVDTAVTQVFLEACLNLLTPYERFVLVQHHLNGLPDKKIADLLREAPEQAPRRGPAAVPDRESIKRARRRALAKIRKRLGIEVPVVGREWDGGNPEFSQE